MRCLFLICLTCLSSLTTFCASSRQIIFETLHDVKSHIDKRFEEVEVETYPFPHLVIENILPTHLYDKIDLYWPNENEFIGVDQRSILAITYGSLEDTNLTKEQKVFWRIFGEVIVDRYIKQNIIRKLAPYFSLKWGMQDFSEDVVQIENFHQLRQNCLINDRRDYRISPHVDQLNLFAAILLYLPKDNKHQTFGTTFYEGPHARDPNLIYNSYPHQLKEAKTIPYNPNTLVTFLQTPFSWHGVKTDSQRDVGYIRRMYVAPIFLSPEFMEKYYSGIYNRHPLEDYYFDHRFLCRKNWYNIWGSEDAYQ
jgi:hypothetical protein